jgi:hypothetical protein
MSNDDHFLKFRVARQQHDFDIIVCRLDIFRQITLDKTLKEIKDNAPANQSDNNLEGNERKIADPDDSSFK